MESKLISDTWERGSPYEQYVGRSRLRDRILARLPLQADGSIPLTARAWAVRATVAG